MSEYPTREDAIAALKAVLAELPVEFSQGPPSDYSRYEFRVIKPSNVAAVHRGLWTLQQFLSQDAWRERRLGVEMAFADQRLDGLHPSERSVRDAEAYIAGEATLEELNEQAKGDFTAEEAGDE